MKFRDSAWRPTAEHRDRLSAADVARMTRGRKRVKEYVGHCPLTHNHKHGDRHPSLSIRDGRTCVVLLCRVCGRERTPEILAALHIHPSQLFYADAPVRRFSFTDSRRPRPLPVILDPTPAWYEHLRRLYRATARLFRALSTRIEAGEFEWKGLWSEVLRELERLHIELCELEKEGYRHGE